MVRLMRWLLVPAFVVGLVGATPVAAQNRTSFVHDEAGFFSKEAVASANAEINQIRNQFHRELVVDTVVTVKRPESLDKSDAQAINRFFDTWAQNRASDERVNGVYIAIVQNPPKVRVLEGNKTEQSGIFQANDRRQLEELVIADLKAAHGDDMKNREKNDKVLAGAVRFVHQHMSQHAAQVAQNRQAAPAPVHRGEIPWLKYLLIGVGIFLVIWIVFGLIRALSGGGARGGYGGYGAPGYGGGGGGFFSSLLGGMFGAAAGMWMYNNFFGGHSNSAWGAGPDAGGMTGGNDADTNYSGGGGDYGDAGGDQGGGGDWGGGGGGGGGDWGGGGGGDWGGGGGGDFGGGGGGGDW